MLVTIYPVATFHGASNAEGTKTQTYHEGKPYEVHQKLADLFIANGLVAIAPVEPENAHDADSLPLNPVIEFAEEPVFDYQMEEPGAGIEIPGDPDGETQDGQKKGTRKTKK